MANDKNLIHNEQTKLRATFLNGLGIALFAVGGLAPLFSALNNDREPTLINLATSGFCFLGGIALHYVGQRILKRLIS